MQIRPAQKADVPYIERLFATWIIGSDGKPEAEQIEFFKASVVASLERENEALERFIVAIDDSANVVGILGYRVSLFEAVRQYATSAKPVQITMLMVERERTKRGIGRMLANSLEDIARKDARTEIILTSSERWKESWEFYRKMGYADLGEMKNDRNWHTRIFSKRIDSFLGTGGRLGQE